MNIKLDKKLILEGVGKLATGAGVIGLGIYGKSKLDKLADPDADHSGFGVIGAIADRNKELAQYQAAADNF